MKPFRFEIQDNHFLRDGREHRIFGGALHYFRVPPESWEDRLLKYRACGLNTVETYLPWNLHEPAPGDFQFSDGLDLRRFVTLAGDLGLDVLLRPGPYICAEWDNGGLPAWLMKDPDMRVRCSHPPFLAATERYLRRVITEVGDLQCHQGGPVIGYQIENEYGSFGNDQTYLKALESVLIDAGVEVLLFTSDDPSDYTLQGGTLPHILKTVNFGSRAAIAFEALRRHQPTGPLMCMEFWVGWFEHWGGERQLREPEDVATVLDDILTLGGSFNIYMMHGGTNFGFLNGANIRPAYTPTTTSYDYDAPLNERGEPTPKYFAIRRTLEKHGALTYDLPDSPPASGFPAPQPAGQCPLFDILPTLDPPVVSPHPLAMEEVDQSFGFILYRTQLSGPRAELGLAIKDLHDRAWVFQDGKRLGVLDRNDPTAWIPVTVSESQSRLDILVENLGRINHGGDGVERKGILGGVRFAGQLHFGWETYPLDLTTLPALSWKSDEETNEPTFYRMTFPVDVPRDTFLWITGGHGIAWINGFCLGRYWKIGPQKSLYIPASHLRSGDNELIILEVDHAEKPQAVLEAFPY